MERETRAVRLAGVTFFTLAAYLVAESIHDLVSLARPEQSVAGLAVTAAAMLIMPGLAIAKRRAGQALGNRTCSAGTMCNGPGCWSAAGWCLRRDHRDAAAACAVQDHPLQRGTLADQRQFPPARRARAGARPAATRPANGERRGRAMRSRFLENQLSGPRLGPTLADPFATEETSLAGPSARMARALSSAARRATMSPWPGPTGARAAPEAVRLSARRSMNGSGGQRLASSRESTGRNARRRHCAGRPGRLGSPEPSWKDRDRLAVPGVLRLGADGRRRLRLRRRRRAGPSPRPLMRCSAPIAPPGCGPGWPRGMRPRSWSRRRQAPKDWSWATAGMAVSLICCSARLAPTRRSRPLPRHRHPAGRPHRRGICSGPRCGLTAHHRAEGGRPAAVRTRSLCGGVQGGGASGAASGRHGEFGTRDHRGVRRGGSIETKAC